MAVRLEVFPNLSVYQLQTHESVVSLPIDITQVTAFSKQELSFESIPISLVKSSPFTIGQTVTVKSEDNVDKTGLLVALTDEYLDLFSNINGQNSTIRIYNPKEVVTNGNYSHDYYLQNDTGTVVTGILKNVYWKPSYTCIINSETQFIQNFMLLAQVKSSGPPFTVNQLIFNTREVLFQQRAASAMLADQAQENIAVENTYYFDEETIVQPRMSLPLAEYDQTNTPRVYFLQINKDAVVEYGYILTLSTQTPPGMVTIYDNTLAVMGISQLQVYGTTAILKVAPEKDILTTITLDNAKESIHFDVNVISHMHTRVQLILQLPIYKQVIESRPAFDARLPGMLLWYLEIEPGDSHFQTKIQLAE